MRAGQLTAAEQLSVVCRHLALVAIDGPSPEVEATLDPGFVLSMDGMRLSAASYLALVEANHAAHPVRPPLEVIAGSSVADFVTVLLDGHGISRFRLKGALIEQIWLAWSEPLWNNLRQRMAT